MDTIDGLNQQLHALYDERALGDLGTSLPEAQAAGLLSSVQSLEAQLATFYADAEELSLGHRDAVCMSQNLVEQVAVLLEERNDLQRECEQLKSDVHATKRRAREMIDVLVSQSLN